MNDYSKKQIVAFLLAIALLTFAALDAYEFFGTTEGTGRDLRRAINGLLMGILALCLLFFSLKRK